MKTKNIFKALALAMLMPAMLLTTACSNDDDVANTSYITNEGYALPVTVNVTRGGDATRATFDGSKLNFSDGDQLFVNGDYDYGSKFAGTLTWQSGGTFSGTIYTSSGYSGTADDLFSSAMSIYATLLPAGYDSYNFLSINDKSTSEKYDDEINVTKTKSFVASATAKATGVEQLSLEQAFMYSSGFALTPQNAILNFTISGLSAGAKDVTLKVYDGDAYSVRGSVTPNASGVATFAIGVPNSTNIRDAATNLTVGSSNFTLPSGTALTAGKIYNITRGTGATVNLSTKNTAYTAQNGETLTGTLASNVQISIADGATVILNNVNINGSGTWASGNYAGITCVGDATIILNGTNTVKGFNGDYPGIHVPVGNTVTIKGSGSLTASSNGGGAGIGGGWEIACGNIEIQGGTVTATGANAAGIGGGLNATCGNILISGGTVTATGANQAAGIGSGKSGGASCGSITISGGTVTATGGGEYGAGIGSGNSGTCGNILISGGTVTATGGNQAAGIGSSYYASCGTITISGGTVEATGGISGAGIGSGFNGTCNDITITSGVTHVTATKGDEYSSSIGAGDGGSCGTVTIADPSKVTQN